jgi:hypothetical protein
MQFQTTAHCMNISSGSYIFPRGTESCSCIKQVDSKSCVEPHKNTHCIKNYRNDSMSNFMQWSAMIL